MHSKNMLTRIRTSIMDLTLTMVVSISSPVAGWGLIMGVPVDIY